MKSPSLEVFHSYVDVILRDMVCLAVDLVVLGLKLDSKSERPSPNYDSVILSSKHFMRVYKPHELQRKRHVVAFRRHSGKKIPDKT